MTSLALFGQALAMIPEHQRSFLAQLKAVTSLAGAGLSPADARDAAYNGKPTVVPVVNGDQAYLAIHGALIARAPWFAKAFMEALDPFDVAAALDALASDPQFTAVKTVVIEVDSCGGTVDGTGEIVAALARLQASGRTVEVRIEGTCASAAYWAIAGADRILASPTSVVGGIGVFSVLTDVSAAEAAEGRKPEVISSSPLKGLGYDGRVTQEMRTEYQRLTDARANVFYDAVSAGRALIGPALAAVTTGQVWLAKEAQALSLIDGVASLAEEPTPPSNQPAPEATIEPIELDGNDEGSGAHAALPRTDQSTTRLPSTKPPRNQQESVMDVKTQAALAALTNTHPALASSLVTEACKPNATAADLEAFAHKALAKSKDDEIAALKTRAEAAEAKAKAEGEAKAKAEAALAKLKAHTPNYQDPGPGDEDKNIRKIPLAQAGSLTVQDLADIRAGKAAIDVPAV